MHLLKDENGNVIPHGAHSHEEHHHHHDHDHDHGHHHDHHDHCHETGCGACESEKACKDENLALLTYMLQHNQHHAAELDQMADKLAKSGMETAAKQIHEAVTDFEKGNMRLSVALALVKDMLKGSEN